MMINGRVSIRIRRTGVISIPDRDHLSFVWQSGGRVTVTLDEEVWLFEATAFTVDRRTDDGPWSDSTLKLPLRAVYEVSGMRFALDAAGIVWISHYSPDGPAVDGIILHRPGHRDAMFSTNRWAPDLFRFAFGLEPRPR